MNAMIKLSKIQAQAQAQAQVKQASHADAPKLSKPRRSDFQGIARYVFEKRYGLMQRLAK